LPKQPVKIYSFELIVYNYSVKETKSKGGVEVKQTRDTRSPTDALILVAEDDVVSTIVLKNLFGKAGLRADFVTDGNKAIEALSQADYDLVLMDCFMPRLDGFETTCMIRNGGVAGINPDIPVIAMTGLSGDDNRQRCLDAGMSDHLCKPVTLAELVLKIEQHLCRSAGKPECPQELEEADEPVSEESLLETMIDGFLTEIPGVIDDLLRALEQRDVAELERIGHRLRGACDIMGVSTLSKLSRALEQAGKAGDITIGCQRASELIVELQKMEAVLTGSNTVNN
jgi:CheY-like chemotaxis protein